VRPRIVVAEDNEAFLQKLISLLAVEFDVVGAAADGKSALDLIRRHQPDVVVLDVGMPVLNGIEVTREVAKDSPPVVICSVETDPEVIEAARQAGALAYVFKVRVNEDLLLAVKSALQGKPFVSQSLGRVSPVGKITPVRQLILLLEEARKEFNGIVNRFERSRNWTLAKEEMDSWDERTCDALTEIGAGEAATKIKTAKWTTIAGEFEENTERRIEVKESILVSLLNDVADHPEFWKKTLQIETLRTDHTVVNPFGDRKRK